VPRHTAPAASPSRALPRPSSPLCLTWEATMDPPLHLFLLDPHHLTTPALRARLSAAPDLALLAVAPAYAGSDRDR